MKPIVCCLTVAIAVAAVMTPLRSARSQEAHPVAGEVATDPSRSEDPDVVAASDLKSLGGMIISGGSLNVLFFGILGAFSLWSATVVLERAVNLRRAKILPASFKQQISQLVQSPAANVEKMRAIGEAGDSPASRIFRAGVVRAGRPLGEVEKAMEDAASNEVAVLRGKYRSLNVVGNIAPLVGLLGTVVGMIMAFQISSQEGLGKAERLAEGIYLALMTTAAGLTIAIPCLLFASWFQARGEKFMREVAACLTETLPCFARLEGRPMGTVTTDVAKLDHELSVRERFLREGVVEPAKS